MNGTQPVLLVTRGLPGSGKTTFAQGWVAAGRPNRARVNRDTIRDMLDAGKFIEGVTEPRVIAVRDAAILGLLERGVSVVADDTNLPSRTVKDLARLARRAGAAFEVNDLTAVPLTTCLERNAKRADYVKEPVIREMHERYLAGRVPPLPVPALDPPQPGELVRYEPVPGTPEAVLLDVDGTAALHDGRSPYDYTRVSEDLPNTPVIAVAAAMHAAGRRIIVLSGRPVSFYDHVSRRMVDCFADTSEWLDKHLPFPLEALLMRPAGDDRPDVEVKLGLFNANVRGYYTVVCSLEDRRQMVALWRALGITTLQVGEGDF